MEKNSLLSPYPVDSPVEVKVTAENTPINNHSQKANTVFVTGCPTLVIADFGPEAQIVTCPYCHHFITTRVKTNATTKTHLFALLLCMCCCWLCSCCPYIIDSCQDRNHYCPQCRAYLGSYRA